MIRFFITQDSMVYAVETNREFDSNDIAKLQWAFEGAEPVATNLIEGYWVGPRREMISPWSTNAVEIVANMNIVGVSRIESFYKAENENSFYDPMLEELYHGLDEQIFTIDRQPEEIQYIEDIEAYNKEQGLALSDEEVVYLEGVSKKIGRKLTDSELFGFSQVNSEHCRHKIFGGKFVIDGMEKERSLFQMIKDTSKAHPNELVSAYKDNVAFLNGPMISQFAPESGDKPSLFSTKEVETVISLKAETHNFPTTVEPFNGAATGSGGEIRDRMAGGKASIPMAGTAVYMTAYPRLTGGKRCEEKVGARKWLYQSPQEILTKASNGASDFGNKFGQPLITGSVLTFEHKESASDLTYAYDKVIMLAGGIGYARKSDALKDSPKPGEKIVILGGDNYRIGMGGGAVSSVNTGHFAGAIELNAVQRANPEMQKRVQNVIRTFSEGENPIVSIHDHGAGGHLNCLSELVEETGGRIEMDQLPVGDPTLSAKEIIGNESQERMGLVMEEKDLDYVKKVADRERAPMYVVGETTNDMRFVFEKDNGEKPIDMNLKDMFGNPPKTIMSDKHIPHIYQDADYREEDLPTYIKDVLRLEAVGCKDWLTNKVDRSVTGKVARQQCQGELQLPLSDLGAVALDFNFHSGIATSIGHAPQVALADAAKGSVVAIAEALTNLVFAPLKNGMDSVSLSANWMWPCRNEGEDARLYDAVEAVSDFSIALGINVPTGKDSLSMTQKYEDEKVLSPGTVIISAVGEVKDVRKTVSPVVQMEDGSALYYIDLSSSPLVLGGSAFFQSLGAVGRNVATVSDAAYFKKAFNTIQSLIESDAVIAGHDISAGGLITTLLEMCFGQTNRGMKLDFCELNSLPLITLCFAENPGVVLQLRNIAQTESVLRQEGIRFVKIGEVTESIQLEIKHQEKFYQFSIDEMRAAWFEPSHLMDSFQSTKRLADERAKNLGELPLKQTFPNGFEGKLTQLHLDAHRTVRSGVKAAILRDKGTNGEREMAYSLYLAGFDVVDVHLSDLISGRETLADVQMLVFCGGFSNSDVLGSAKGWAGGILYNEKAKEAIEKFYARKDTMSLGICNGCQLMAELGVLYPNHEKKHHLRHNQSGRFESCFVGLEIPQTNAIMLQPLIGMTLGVWCAHGEGRFEFPYEEFAYHIAARYQYDSYPANPNGSPQAVAGVVSQDGRHLAMMPHPERSILPWQCGFYPYEKMRSHEVTPWMLAFRSAYEWCKANQSW